MRAPDVTFSRARRLRREMTLPEVVLWQALRKGLLAGYGFAGNTGSGLTFLISIALLLVWRSRWMGPRTTRLLGCAMTSGVRRGFLNEG